MKKLTGTTPSTREDARERESFIRNALDEMFRTWLVRGCLIGSVIFMSLSALDFLVAPQHFAVFFLYRLAAAAILLAVGFSGRAIGSPAVMRGLGLFVIACSAAAIELMILRFGGHTSIYYPGMILLGVVVFGIFPAGTAFHLKAAGIIYGTFLLPLLVVGDISNPSYFLAANTFILGTFATSVLLRHLSYESLRKRIGLQFDLEAHREQLENNVRERTEQLSEAVDLLRQEVAVRERSEEELIGVLNEWRATFDSASDMIFLLDGDLRIRRLNRAAAGFLGLDPPEAVNRPFLDLLGESFPGGDDHPLAKSARSRKHEEEEVYLPARGRWYTASADPVLAAGGEWIGAVHYLHDITDVHTMQEQISRAKTEWEETFDVINDAITIHDSSFRIIRANRAACDLLGASMESVLKRRCFESYHGSDAPPKKCPSCEVFHSGKACTTELFEPHLGKHLEVKALPKLDEHGKVSGLVHIVRDITLRKQAEEQRSTLQDQLQHAQKMESIGRLAGGIAHDFNNILFAMLGYAELATRKIPEDHPAQKSLQVIRDSGARAAELNHQLLAFSRKQVLNLQSVSLGESVRQMGAMLERLIGEEISLRIEGEGSVGSIQADKGQIEQVVMNLVINARDALAGGGEILLAAADVSLHERATLSSGTVDPGAYVELLVSDNGCGMSPEVREKMFEPFFTTKKAGEGSGLGLSTVYGIVQQHGGHLNVTSQEGRGTTIRVLFPAACGGAEARPEETSAEPAAGSETVLVVEDEQYVRQLAKDVLEPLGYRLLLARNGQDALEVLQNHEGEIDLLLTDVVMPAMNGREFADHFHARHPGAPVIFMSGYADDIISRHGVVDGKELLLKPVMPHVLARTIRQVLDGRYSPAE